MAQEEFILRMEHISKHYPGVQALDDVSIQARRGEIHALVGENGAGKSTLMKILGGAVQKDSGQIFLRGWEVNIDTPRRAQELGISMIYQELSLIPFLNVGQNIYLGREPRGRVPTFIDWPRLYAQAREQLQRLGMGLDPLTPVSELTIAAQQMVEVAKALSYNADVIVMDEPTSALTERETETLFKVMGTLRDQGVTILFISHRLEEVFRIADRVTVMRDGRFVAVAPVNQLHMGDVVRMMVGRELGEMFPKKSVPRPDVVLRVEGLGRGGWLENISFELHRGEILGLAGLVGAGRTETARAIFGIDPIDQGQIWLNERPVRIHSPRAAIRLGMGFVPEDRKDQGLFLGMAVRENITLDILRRLSFLGFLRFREMNGVARDYVKELGIRTPSIYQRVRNLSGGNQQKVVIARWLTLKPQVLILDEPTRGIDVGAKAEIYALMDQLAANGIGVLMISSELPEVLGVSDRILVMREGSIVAEFSRQEATQDKIIACATGGTDGCPTPVPQSD